ncbi:NUDIX domain-containing protein [Calidithermus roseus]|uniref:Methanol dehydrogenase activator n=1 Tax=Calidithermus roseus TaxID=1644118 RepID=A0A399EY65_9DEIN|nr:NUDIX hydrolase [Calidithermus roseus]RIH88535.1 Methanol dehydrogenase activator [Calidithermus roseus]
MTDPEDSPWQTLSSELVYDNRWIAVTHREVINPSGNPGVYGVVHFKNRAIGVLPLDEEGNTYLVGQYRYTLGRYSWEIPEGGGPFDEEPLEAAKRELLEETGLRADHWELLLTLHLSNSVTDEVGMVYLARGLHQGEASPEDTEDLRVQKVPLEEVYRRVLGGEITDSLTVAAVLRARLLLLEQGRW